MLNGWIFSAFGLFDAWKLTGKQEYLDAWEKVSNGIKNSLCKFDAGHWSYYDMDGKLTSPFYHSLHIELLKALNHLSPDSEYERYIDKWGSRKKIIGFGTRWLLYGKLAKDYGEANRRWVMCS